MMQAFFLAPGSDRAAIVVRDWIKWNARHETDRHLQQLTAVRIGMPQNTHRQQHSLNNNAGEYC